MSSESGRRQKLRKRYGITIEQYDAMLAKQGGVCAICSTDVPGAMGRFQVDHDHNTGRVRGLLCFACNIAIGKLRDDPQLCIRAADYLSGGPLHIDVI